MPRQQPATSSRSREPSHELSSLSRLQSGECRVDFRRFLSLSSHLTHLTHLSSSDAFSRTFLLVRASERRLLVESSGTGLRSFALGYVRVRVCVRKGTERAKARESRDVSRRMYDARLTCQHDLRLARHTVSISSRFFFLLTLRVNGVSSRSFPRFYIRSLMYFA